MSLCQIVEPFWWHIIKQPPMPLYPSEDVGSKLQYRRSTVQVRSDQANI